ncbi:MAG: hypothetical protein QXY45_01415 [Candidatus Aenigmatarchaeota archaeon]
MKWIIPLLILLIPSVSGFDAWAVRGGVFVVGQPSTFIVYVNNTDNSQSHDYTIDARVVYTVGGEDKSHLINIHFPSNSIKNVQPRQVKSTQGVILTLFVIKSQQPGEIEFTVTEDTSQVKQLNLQISSSIPFALPDFSNFILIQFIVIILLIVSYTFHLS